MTHPQAPSNHLPWGADARQPSTKEVFQYLQGYVKPFLPLLALVGVLTIAGTGLILAFPRFVSEILNSGTSQVNGWPLQGVNLWLPAAAMLAIVLFRTASNILIAYVSEKIVLELRQSVVSHLLSLSLEFYQRSRVGEIISRVAVDVAVIQQMATTLPLNLLRNGITVIGGVVVAVLLNAKLALVLLPVLPVLAISTIIFGPLVRRLSAEVQANTASANVVLEEALSGIATIKCFVSEGEEIGRYRAWLEKTFSSGMRRSLAQIGMGTISMIIWFGGLSALTMYATTMIRDGELPVGDLVAFLLYGGIVGSSFVQLSGIWSRWQQLLGVAQHLVQVFQETPSVVDSPQASEFDGVHKVIRFQKVGFSYPSDPQRKVLTDFSFSVERGQRVALVGQSGAGKTTAVSLLLRLYDVTEGAITIDNRDIRSIRQEDLRSSIAVVPQDIVVFGRTLRENILYGKRDATDLQMIAAARAAGALEFIERMPEGFDTLLGERGVTLSGGQRQRIAIARAILKDPSILILDEATSSLDKPGDALVRAGLARLMDGRTTFVIAHRLTTIEGADHVLVLHDGRLVESGVHNELLEAGGHYARLYHGGVWSDEHVA